MPVPAIVIGGVWAWRGISAYRAYRAAKLAAQATAAVATVAVGNQAINTARENAATDAGVTTDYCASCQDPKCRDQGKKVRDRRNELQKRHDEMRQDPQNLYQNHYSIANAHPVYGSWVGHVQQFQAKQANLRKLIAEYDKLDNCPKLQGDHWKQASRDAPSAPAPK